MYKLKNSEQSKYKIYKYIKDEPFDIDEILQKSNMNIQDINYEITMLTLEGKIKEIPGQRYIKIQVRN